MSLHTVCGVNVIVSEFIEDAQGEPGILWVPKPPPVIIPAPWMESPYGWRFSREELGLPKPLFTLKQLAGLEPLPDVQGTLTLEALEEARWGPPQIIILCHPDIFDEVREAITEARGSVK